jgi:hypothetical protein
VGGRKRVWPPTHQPTGRRSGSWTSEAYGDKCDEAVARIRFDLTPNHQRLASFLKSSYTGIDFLRGGNRNWSIVFQEEREAMWEFLIVSH